MLPLMVVKSPRCDEMVTLPAGLTPESKVRCPFSKEEFLVQEILDALPPMLVVIDGPAAAATADLVADSAAASTGALAATMFDDVGQDTPADTATASPADATETPGDAAADTTDDAAFGFLDTTDQPDTAEQDEASAKGDALFEPGADAAQPSASAFAFAAADAAESEAEDGTAAPGRRAPRPRPKKKAKSPAAEVIKIALGGIAGLIIALLIMWWGMKRDPFGLAPTVGKFLPWLVPAALRDPGSQQQAPANGGQTAENGTGQDAQSGGNGGQGGEPMVAEPYDPNAGFDLPGSGELAPDVMDDTDHHAGVAEVPDNGGDGDDFAAVFEGGGPNAPPIDPPTEELIGVRSAPFYTGDELGQALKDANEAQKEVEAAGGMDLTARPQDAANMYKVLCKLGERSTFVDPDGAQVQDRLAAAEGILREFSQKKPSLDALGRFGATWLELGDKRPGNGIVLAGTVMSIAQQGKLFDTELQLFAGDQPIVTVMSKNNPNDAYGKGDRVIILGSVVEEPSLKLAGYQGNLPIVTWGGYPIVLPKAEKKGPNRSGRGGN